MTYRDDLDALTARQTALEVELGRKQRELAQVTGLIAEARQAQQVESRFERMPDLLRPQRLHLLVGALVLTLGSSAAIAAATVTDQGPPPNIPQLVQRSIDRIQANRARLEQAPRLRAELEALRTLHLIPVIAPNTREVALGKQLRGHPVWILGSGMPASGSLWAASTHEHER
jgi:hypothetical protein